MLRQKDLDQGESPNLVDVNAVMKQYRAAEDEYLGTLLDESHRQAYRKTTDALFDNKRFVKALGYCGDDKSALAMIVAVRKILMEHHGAPTRYEEALKSAEVHQLTFSKIGQLLRTLEMLSTSSRQAGDAMHSEALIDLLEQGHLKCNEASTYWFQEAEAALRKGGAVSNRGAAKRSHAGAMHGAIARALDRVITPGFSTKKRLGRLELIADLMCFVDPHYQGGGTDIGNLLRDRRRPRSKKNSRNP